MHKHTLTLLVLAGLVAVATVFLGSNTPSTAATGDIAIHRYAWSSNIGWISFGDSGGNVVIDSSGNFTGYAWSSNIGWIKFDPVGPYPAAPSHGAQISVTNGEVTEGALATGWARVCSAAPDPISCSGAGANTSSGGWDGWISMSGTGYGVKEVTATSDGARQLAGFAWGSDVVGWVSFDLKGFGSPGGSDCTTDCGGATTGPGGASLTCNVPLSAAVNSTVHLSATATGSVVSPVTWTVTPAGGHFVAGNTGLSVDWVPDSAGSVPYTVTASSANTPPAICTKSITITDSCPTGYQWKDPSDHSQGCELIPAGGAPSVSVTRDTTYIFGQAGGQVAISSPAAKLVVTGAPTLYVKGTTIPTVATCRLKSLDGSIITSPEWQSCNSVSLSVPTGSQEIYFSVRIPSYDPTITAGSPYTITLGTQEDSTINATLHFEYKVSAPINT